MIDVEFCLGQESGPLRGCQDSTSFSGWVATVGAVLHQLLKRDQGGSAIAQDTFFEAEAETDGQENSGSS